MKRSPYLDREIKIEKGFLKYFGGLLQGISWAIITSTLFGIMIFLITFTLLPFESTLRPIFQNFQTETSNTFGLIISIVCGAIIALLSMRWATRLNGKLWQIIQEKYCN